MATSRGSALLLGLLLVATTAVPVAAGPAAPAPASDDQVWIVTLDDDHPSTLHAEALVRRHGGTLRQVYATALNGFSFSGPEQAARNLERSPRVVRVEADQPLQVTGHTTPTGVLRIDAPTAHADNYTGTGVNIAILDTGIDSSHPALDVAADLGKNCIDTNSTSTEDVHGHGTHVAGTASARVAGSTFVGAASHATVVPVKVLGDNGSGSWESVICGVDHVTQSLSTPNPITVANMSLSGSGSAGDACSSSALRQAICNSVTAGVVHVVAAGNDGWNVANSIPAAYPEVITVSALDENRCVRLTGGGPPSTVCDEGLASFSNFGAGVDVMAPGVGIYSTLVGGGYGTKSGTSMAAPHVAGVAALMRSVNAALDPGQIRDLLQGTGECPDGTINTASSGPCSGQDQWFRDPDGIAEPLINAPRAAAAAGGAPPTGDPVLDEPTYSAPEASFTHSCTDLTCSFTDTSTYDSEVTASTYAWEFGDSGTATEANPQHIYAAGGTYTVTLTVTDSQGQSATATEQVTVTAPTADPDEPATGITLGVTTYKVRGVHHVDLVWQGATTNVDIVRDDSTVASDIDNTGSYTDNTGNKGGGSYTYQVCEAGTQICSAQVTAAF